MVWNWALYPQAKSVITVYLSVKWLWKKLNKLKFIVDIQKAREIQSTVFILKNQKIEY